MMSIAESSQPQEPQAAHRPRHRLRPRQDRRARVTRARGRVPAGRAPGLPGRDHAAGAPHPQTRLPQPLRLRRSPSSTCATWNEPFKAGDDVTPETLRGKDLVTRPLRRAEDPGQRRTHQEAARRAPTGSASRPGKRSKGWRRSRRAPRQSYGRRDKKKPNSREQECWRRASADRRRAYGCASRQ